MKIDPELLIAYFKANGATENCPFCGQEEWNITAEEDLTPDHAGIHLFQRELPTGKVLIAFPFVCVKCGFVRFQSVNHFQAWLTERKNDEIKSGG